MLVLPTEHADVCLSFWYQLIFSMQLSKNENFSRHGLHDFIEVTTNKLVEVNGFEPMTSCVQGRRSPS